MFLQIFEKKNEKKREFFPENKTTFAGKGTGQFDFHQRLTDKQIQTKYYLLSSCSLISCSKMAKISSIERALS